MFNRKPANDGLDAIITKLESEILTKAPHSEEYAQMVIQLDMLYTIKTKSHDRVSMDTWVAVGANLAGIVLIVGHERANVITSKAISLVRAIR